jgi:hypothetical protein
VFESLRVRVFDCLILWGFKSSSLQSSVFKSSVFSVRSFNLRSFDLQVLGLRVFGLRVFGSSVLESSVFKSSKLAYCVYVCVSVCTSRRASFEKKSVITRFPACVHVPLKCTLFRTHFSLFQHQQNGQRA